jgi:hypothetical protein
MYKYKFSMFHIFMHFYENPQSFAILLTFIIRFIHTQHIIQFCANCYFSVRRIQREILPSCEQPSILLPILGVGSNRLQRGNLNKSHILYFSVVSYVQLSQNYQGFISESIFHVLSFDSQWV